MNIQTERLENHTARFTVEVDVERFDHAKQQAARQIAKQVRIPGFRKGKVPYHIMIQRGFEGEIVMEAIESLSQEVYRETIEASDVEPFGPGAFEDYTLDPLTFVYTVPLQPTVELNDYLSVRVDWESPELEDEAVDDAMKRLQEQEALTEDSSNPVELGNVVTVDIHSEFVDDAPESTEETEEEGESSEEKNAPAAGDQFIHEHDASIRLDPEDEPVLPGFNQALVGSNVGDELEFELAVPEDDDDYEDIAGRKVKFHVTVKKVQTITLPELTDELAARITKDEEEPLTLLQLRARMRENMEKELERQYKETYANRVIDQMVEIADMSYPEDMVQSQIQSMIKDLENRLSQQRVSLDLFYSVSGKTEDDLKEEYREPAIRSLERSLVLGEVMQQQNISVDESAIQDRIDEMVRNFGESGEQFRSFLDSPQMRNSLINEMLQDKVFDRIAIIGRGEFDESMLEESEAPAEEAASEETGGVDELPVEDSTDVEGDSASDEDQAEEK